MKRIATANREIDKFGGGKDGFRAAVPGVSDPTYLSAEFCNSVQEALVRVVERAGLVPSDDHDQFGSAIAKLLEDSALSATLDLAGPDGVLQVGNAADKRALAAPTGAGQVGYLAPGVGAVPTTVEDELRRVGVSPMNKGAAADGAADDRTAIQAAWDDGPASARTVLMDAPFLAAGQLTTSNNLHVRGTKGAWLKQTAASVTGSFIQNMRSSSSDIASIQSDITFENLDIDGANYPSPITLVVASAVGSTVTFTAVASAVDGAYVGMYAEDTAATGVNAATARAITGYVGATRTATLSAAWGTAPAGGVVILVGNNDNAMGFAAGVSNLAVRGGHVKNYPQNKMVPSANGGKGVNFEQGVTDGVIENEFIEGAGTAYFVQGLDGAFANGAKKRAVSIRVTNSSAKNVGSLLTIAGINTAASPDGDSDDSMVIASGLTYENAGHSPWRLCGSDQQKSGIINLVEAQNVSVSGIRGRNDSTYPNTAPGYPADYAARCGYGLSGNVGAMIWGHGRNIKIDGFVHHGDVDNVITVRRGRALGDDGGPTGAPRNCLGWQIRGLELHGICQHVINIDATPALRIAAAELTGYIECVVDTVSTGICDATMSTFTGLVLDVTERGTGKRIIGTAAQIIAAGNTFASFLLNYTDMRSASTFTPVLLAGANVQPLGTALGFFSVRDGRCHFSLRVLMNGAIVGTGNLSISGLPIAASSAGSVNVAGVWGAAFTGLTGALTGLINGLGTSMSLWQSNAVGHAVITEARLTAATEIRVTGSYLI